MKAIKIIFCVGVLIAAFASFIDIASEGSGAATAGAFTGLLILGGIPAYLLYKELSDLNKPKNNP